MLYLCLTAKFSKCTVKEKKGNEDPNTPQSVQPKRLTWYLQTFNEKFASSINYNEFDVGKQSQIYSMKM